MPIVIKEQHVPIYETTCCECGSVFRYKAVEVSWMTYITCPVCGVSNWASLTPINDDTDGEMREDPVRHGHWEVDEDCPNCGAKMDEEDERR